MHYTVGSVCWVYPVLYNLLGLQGFAQDLRARDCQRTPTYLGNLTLPAGLRSNWRAKVRWMTILHLYMERFNNYYFLFQLLPASCYKCYATPQRLKKIGNLYILPATTFFPNCKLNLSITGVVSRHLSFLSQLKFKRVALKLILLNF